MRLILTLSILYFQGFSQMFLSKELGVNYYVLSRNVELDPVHPKKNSVVINVDTSRTAPNFISILDELILDYRVSHGKKYMDSILDKRQLAYKDPMLREVKINNYTNSTIKLQHMDTDLFCTIELYLNGHWVNQRCKGLSWCGNSYFYHSVPAKYSTGFLFKMPSSGDTTIKARFKVLGENTFYYSNSFYFTTNKTEIVGSDQMNTRGYKEGEPYEGNEYCFKKPHKFVIVE